MGRMFIITSMMVMLGACASISEEQCLAGDWQELGFEDGTKGANIDRVHKYTNVCAEHGVSVQANLYSKGYEQGLPLYCTHRRGLNSGTNGSSFNQACTGFIHYEQAYSQGRVVYEIEREYAYLLDEYESLSRKFYELADKFSDASLTDKERKDLKRKQSRIKRNLRGLRIDILAFESLHGFSQSCLEAF